MVDSSGNATQNGGGEMADVAEKESVDSVSGVLFWELLSGFDNEDDASICRAVAEVLSDEEMPVDGECLPARWVLARKLQKLVCVEPLLAQQYMRVADYLCELWWIASGQLLEALMGGLVGRRRLAVLLMHPDVLPIAQMAIIDGEECFDRELPGECREGLKTLNDLINERQGETFTWLCDEVESGRLRQYAGQSVAALSPEQPTSDLRFVVAGDPVTAGMEAAKTWMVPRSMIAVVNVPFAE